MKAHGMGPHLEDEVTDVEDQEQDGDSVTHGQKILSLFSVGECQTWI
jgi:hypothetical protein